MAPRPFNFSAGPATMPAEVLAQAADEMLDWPDASGRRCGMGEMEMSHRGREFGEILARASVDQEETVVVEVNLASVDTQRTHWPFLRDRRIDAYGDITRRFID
jgi:predicted amidohydrolase